MRVKIQVRKTENKFPWESLALSLFLILSVQFIDHNLLFAPFLIQLYRILRYGEHVFMVDWAILVNFATIFRLPIGGAVGILVIIAAIWFLLHKQRYRLTCALMILPILVIYLFFRASGKMEDYLFISSTLIVSYLLINQCTTQDSVRVAKGFVFGILLASIYGFIFRGSAAITYYIAEDSTAIYGVEDALRFRAIFGDSNYYSCYLILGIILAIELYILRQSNLIQTMVVLVLLSGFGVATYSRTFFLMLAVLLVYSIYLLFKNGKKAVACCLTAVITIIVGMVGAGKISAFDVVLARFFSADGLSGMTSGRSGLLTHYGTYILENTPVLIFGKGLNADLLGKIGTHNLYIEILYFIGSVGGLLYASYLFSLIKMVRSRRGRYHWKQTVLSVLPICFMLMLYFSLQGMFMTATYTLFFIAISAMLLPSISSTERGATKYVN